MVISKRYYNSLLYGSLTVLLFIFACSTVDPVSKEILIEGGHQVSLVDGDFEFKYGIYNDQCEPTTIFEEGQEIIFSYWLINKTDKEFLFVRSMGSGFMTVYDQNDPIPLGNPFDLCEQGGGVVIGGNQTFKVHAAWQAETVSRGYWCGPLAQLPLKKGSYKTEFHQCFSFSFDDGIYETEALNFSIEFEVK